MQEKIPGAPEHDLLSFRGQIAQTYVQTLSMKKVSVQYLPPRVAVDQRVLTEVRMDATDY